MNTESTHDGLRIVRLRISAFKGISVADITPPELGTVVVSGRNGAGKSSLMDAIAVALGGGPEIRQVAKPVKKGSSHSQIIVDLGDLTVTREWNNERTWLTVTGADGVSRRSPQRLLDTLLGRLSFDPGAFLNESPAKQRDMLLQATGLGDVVSRIDAQRKDATDERRFLNRDIKSLQSRLESIPEPSPELPVDEVTVTELVDRIRSTENANQRVLAARRRCTELSNSIAETRHRIQQLQESLELQEFELSETKETAQQELVDVTDLESQVSQIDSLNAEVRSAQQWREVAASLDDRQKQAERIKSQLIALDEQKASALAQADLPVPGLGVDDDGILFDGVRFQDVNTATKLQTATAIAMALNPTIRIIRIADGSLLDRENLAALHELAADKGYQVWVERVEDDNNGDGIVIEEGAIVANSYEDALR